MAQSKTADYVITLVHGTWAQDAEWPNENGPLARKLQESLGGRVLINRFGWSGGNSYWAREEAGKDLRQRLSRSVDQHRDAHHFVIAHSHGGNVALYALNEPRLAKSMSGLVTLATPFLSCEPRNPWFLIQVCIYGATFGLAFAVLKDIVLPLVLRGIEFSHSFSGWLEIGVYIGMLWLGYAAGSIVWGVLQGLAEGVSDWLIDTSSDVQSALLSMLSTTHCAGLPLLALRFRGDEARLYLALLSMITMPFPLLLKVTGYLFLIVYIMAFLMVVADVLAEFARALFYVSIPYFPWIIARNLYYLSVLVLFVTLVGALALPKLIRGHRFGYGRERLVTPILMKITATDLPKSFSNAAIMRYRFIDALRSMTRGHGLLSILKLRLVHSWLYQYDPTIEDIVTWIKQTTASTHEESGVRL